MRSAAQILDRLAKLLDGVDEPATWEDHVFRLDRLAGSLGFADMGAANRPLETLLACLAEVSEIRLRLGRGSEMLRWGEFVDEVHSLVRVLAIPEGRAPAASVRITTVDAAAGVRAEVVILANLGEGTFPSREALDIHDTSGDPIKEREALAARSAAR